MISIKLNDNILQLRTPYSEKDRCVAIKGGRWNPHQHAWEYMATPATAQQVLALFGNAISGDIKPRLQVLASRLVYLQSIFNETFQDIKTPVGRMEPRKCQVISYNIALMMFGFFDDEPIGGGAGIFLDMGLGKSKVVVDIITNHPDRMKSVLLVCPNKAKDVWIGTPNKTGQFRAHAINNQFDRLHLTPLLGNQTIQKRAHYAEEQRAFAYRTNKQFICVVNYEAIWREPLASWALEVPWSLIVLDEGHRIKAATTKISKFFEKLSRRCVGGSRLTLTGTPIPHSPLDAFGQYRYLDSGIFGTSYGAFKAEHAITKTIKPKIGEPVYNVETGEFEQLRGKEVDIVVGYKNTEKLHDKMFSIAYYVESRDVIDLPSWQDIERMVELEGEEKRIYAEMDKQFCAEVDDGIVTAANAMVKLLRLQQITSGHLDNRRIGTAKQELLEEVLDELAVKEPIPIFATFHNDLDIIAEVAKKQGRRYGELSGRRDDLDAWQGGKYDVLGVQIQSGKEAVDFTRARYSIYYSHGLSRGNYQQSRKRTDRTGQTRKGTYIHLLVENSVDIKVMRALQLGIEVTQAVLRAYKER